MLRSEYTRNGRNRRRHARSRSLFSGSVHHDGVMAVDCVVRDISASGARVTLQWAIAGHDQCILDIDGLGLYPARIAWRRGSEAGLQFLVDPGMDGCQINANGRNRLPG